MFICACINAAFALMHMYRCPCEIVDSYINSLSQTRRPSIWDHTPTTGAQAEPQGPPFFDPERSIEKQKAAAKEVKTVAKLTEQLAKLFDLEELDDDLKERVAAAGDSAGLKALIVAEKAGLKAEKKRATQIRKLAEKRALLIAEIHALARRVGGGVKFSENEVENSDMDGLKEIRKTLKKCIRKLERADRKACTADATATDAAQFDREMIALPIC